MTSIVLTTEPKLQLFPLLEVNELKLKQGYCPEQLICPNVYTLTALICLKCLLKISPGDLNRYRYMPGGKY